MDQNGGCGGKNHSYQKRCARTSPRVAANHTEHVGVNTVPSKHNTVTSIDVTNLRPQPQTPLHHHGYCCLLLCFWVWAGSFPKIVSFSTALIHWCYKIDEARKKWDVRPTASRQSQLHGQDQALAGASWEEAPCRAIAKKLTNSSRPMKKSLCEMWSLKYVLHSVVPQAVDLVDL